MFTNLLTAGLSNEYTPRVVSPVSSSSSISSNSNISSNISLASDNSDIRILDEAIDLRVNTVMPNVLPFPMNQPGKNYVILDYVILLKILSHERIIRRNIFYWHEKVANIFN